MNEYEQDAEARALAALMLAVKYSSEAFDDVAGRTVISPEEEEIMSRLRATPLMELIAAAERREVASARVDQGDADGPIHRAVTAVMGFFEEIALGETPCLAPALALAGADNGQSDDRRVLLIGDAISRERGMSWLGDSLRIFRTPAPEEGGAIFTVEVVAKNVGGDSSPLKVSLKWAGGTSNVILTAERPSRMFPVPCPLDWHDLRLWVEPV